MTYDARDDMSDQSPQSDESRGTSSNETATGNGLGPDLGSSKAPEAAPSAMEGIDHEVAEAMAAMDPADLAELCGEAAISQDTIPGLENESVAPGTELIGTVADGSGNEVILEFGAKCQGILPRSQFGKKEAVEPGRRVDVVVERFDASAGMLIVNRKGAVQRATWTNLSQGTIVEGRVTGVIKGGLELDVQGIRAFMPASQVDLVPMKDISVLLNETVRCEVVELDRRSKNVVLSRRRVLDREQAEAREKLRQELEVGQLRKGVVGTIADFGAFIDLGGIDGLVHIRELSWGTVEKVSDVLSPGQEVEVRVLKIDAKRSRISLGLKQAQPDPWVSIPERYPEGTTLKVRIVRVTSFGAFAELEAGVEGLIPISEMAWTRVRNASEVVTVGDMVDAVVIRLEPEKHRLAVSMKQAQPDPWAGVMDSFSEQTVVTGRVTRLADFGAFVELAPGVEGLIHISELADRRVKSCGEVVEEGQVVEARVLGVDGENRRISLSIKQVSAPAKPDAPSKEEPKPVRKKRKKPLRGGLASHFEW